ncbi:MAG: substrate-binding domain-containing protein [Ghiorsea sp.]|nr:substrate-binding domain-containing protein [Ghiorsea sp.]
MANPDVAPFGLATKQVLQQAGLWQSLQAKLVYAQNAMQAAMMVNQGLVDAGFIPIADKTYALATVPYVAVLLSHTKSAQMFYDFLGSSSHR